MTDLVPASPSPVAQPGEQVLPSTAARIRDGIPENTLRAYGRVARQFEQWCTEHGRTPWPTSSVVLADYVAHLADLNRAPATIKSAMGAISALNQAAGHPPLGKDVTKAARLVLTGHRKSREPGATERQAPPITRDRLRAMSAAAREDGTLAGRRDQALLVLGWCLAARESELTVLRIQDVQIADDGLHVRIRWSKTDKNALGETVFVPAGEHVDTDPVGLVRAYLAALAERGVDVSQGPLLRAVTKDDRPRTLKSVVSKDGVEQHYGGLSPAAVDPLIQRCARRAGLPNPGSYTGHSLRSGFATQAAEDGIPLGVWAKHGRWDPKSPVPHSYVRAADMKRDNPLRRMGL